MPELKASVTIESNQNNKYILTETGSGNYKMGPVNLDINQTYSLLVKTSNGKTYQSDYVPMKQTPPIDSVYYKDIDTTALQFFVNAHDPQNNTHYYRWDYTETWSYVSFIAGYYQYKNGVISAIPDDSLYYTCYRTAPSTQVFTASTTQLTQDVINEQPLGAVAAASEKISIIYSIQVNQYAITREGLDYWTALKKNTEQLGSIFDAQPSQNNGNIHCISNPSEPVIGFISASSISRKRIFVRYNDFPFRAPYYFPPPSPEDCTLGTLHLNPPGDFAIRAKTILARGDSVLVLYYDQLGYYTYAPKDCVDCRTKGGTNIRPSYFPLF